MIRVNRAPVLTLWATVVAERLGFDRDAALTLGRAVAGSSAQMKGRALGIYEPFEEPPSTEAEEPGFTHQIALVAGQGSRMNAGWLPGFTHQRLEVSIMQGPETSEFIGADISAHFQTEARGCRAGSAIRAV